MMVFAEGLAADPKQAPMLHGLIETMIKSPYRGEYICPPKWCTVLRVTCIETHLLVWKF